MARPLFGNLLAVLILCAVAVPCAWAQAGGAGGAIAVTVVDPTGSVIVDADLELRDLATNTVRAAVTQEVGNYRFVNLPLGAYSLSVRKTGFETQVFNNVTVQAALTTDVRAILKIGTATQTVDVNAEAVLVNTTTNTIGTTVTTSQVENLPIQGRNVTQLTTLMAGYTGTWNGLPTAAQGNNLDGVVSSTSRMKFSGNATPAVGVRLENIQEMTVQTDALDMNQGFGNSAMQINFATRRGGNAFHGMLFEDHRNAALNANSWINNARRIRRPALILNDFGGNFSGPILRDKLFFFGSMAIQKWPSGNEANANVLAPAAQSGLFRYASNQTGVNLLNLAAANGFPNTITPTTVEGLRMINASQGEGVVTPTSDPNINNLGWIYSGATTFYYPTFRIDWNTTSSIRQNFFFNQEKFEQLNGDAPNFPGEQLADLTAADSRRTSYTLGYGLDWTVTPTIINQFRGGFLYFWAGFAQGFDETRRLGLPHLTWGSNITNGYASSPYAYPGPNSRYFPNFNGQNTTSWQKGAHGMNFGVSYWREQDHYWDPPFAWPNYTTGINANDPANAMFTSANFPGATAVELDRARALYGTLVGRVTAISGRTCYDPKRAAYTNFGELCRAVLNEVQSQWGLFFQDSWRVRPTLSINYGLRWDFISPNVDVRNQYHSATAESVFGPSGVDNLFNPGSLNGTATPVLETRPRPYDGWNVTPQPFAGFAWNPKAGDNFLGKLLGGDATVFRGSYSMRRWVTPQQFFWNSAANYGAFYYQNWNSDPGINFAPGSVMLGSNPTLGGDALPPLTFSPPAYQPSAPLSEFTFRPATRLSGFAPDIKQPRTYSWNFGIQRRLGGSRVLELRYNGNRSDNQWIALNTNQVNVFATKPGEASFLDQFKQAQQNLAINGGTSFANNGLPGQGAIPVFEAAFAGATAANGFANSTFIQNLRQGEAARMGLALAGAGAANARYFCNLVGAGFSPCATNLGYVGAGAGYPTNYFQANPYKTGETNPVSYLDSVGYSTYHSAQVELRQQMWHGLQFNANYTFSKNLGIEPGTNWEGQFAQFDLRDLHLSYMPTSFDRRHVFHFIPVYDLPFGKGRTFANQNNVVDKIVGGWTVSSIVKIQTGAPFRLTSGFWSVAQGGDSGVVLNGITRKDLQDAVGVYRVQPGTYNGVGDFVQILDPKFLNGVRGEGGANSQYIRPSIEPGVQGAIVNLYGPRQTFVDMAISKNVAITERMRFKFQANLINAFNHPVFGNTAGGTMSVVGSGFGVVTGTVGPNTVGTQTVSGGTSARQIQVRGQIQF